MDRRTGSGESCREGKKTIAWGELQTLVLFYKEQPIIPSGGTRLLSEGGVSKSQSRR